MKEYKVTYRIHAVKRMAERNISGPEIERVIGSGEVVEDYPDDHPYPSSLMLGVVNGRPVHVVVATNEAESQKIVVTVYEPDLNKWDEGFKTRRRK